MRKIMIIAGLVGLAVPSLGVAQPIVAEPIIIATCLGTGGYSDPDSFAEGDWVYRNTTLTDPSGTFGNPLCLSVQEVGDPTSCEPSIPDPDLFAILGAVDCPASASPLHLEATLRLRAEGDFACGSGTLTSSGFPNDQRFGFIEGVIGAEVWHLDWSATFSEGVGQVTGTATNRDTGETRSLGGTIFIEDGAVADQCDDSAGAQDVGVRLVLQ